MDLPTQFWGMPFWSVPTGCRPFPLDLTHWLPDNTHTKLKIWARSSSARMKYARRVLSPVAASKLVQGTAEGKLERTKVVVSAIENLVVALRPIGRRKQGLVYIAQPAVAEDPIFRRPRVSLAV